MSLHWVDKTAQRAPYAGKVVTEELEVDKRDAGRDVINIAK
jgi:hypothetical protein